jgi:hypothetical protein
MPRRCPLVNEKAARWTTRWGERRGQPTLWDRRETGSPYEQVPGSVQTGRPFAAVAALRPDAPFRKHSRGQKGLSAGASCPPPTRARQGGVPSAPEPRRKWEPGERSSNRQSRRIPDADPAMPNGPGPRRTRAPAARERPRLAVPEWAEESARPPAREGWPRTRQPRGIAQHRLFDQHA